MSISAVVLAALVGLIASTGIATLPALAESHQGAVSSVHHDNPANPGAPQGSGMDGATPAPIDTLVRRVLEKGGIEYTLSATYHPIAMESFVSTGDGWETQFSLTHQFGFELGVEYKASGNFSIQIVRGWSGGVHVVEQLAPSAGGAQPAPVFSQVTPALRGTYGVSWRPLPEHQLDPVVHLQADESGGSAINLSF